MPPGSAAGHPPGIRTDTQMVWDTAAVNAWSSPAAIAVENRLFRALAVLRLIVLVNTVALSIYRADSFERPTAAAACLGVLVLWTGFTTWAYAEPQRRTAP